MYVVGRGGSQLLRVGVRPNPRKVCQIGAMGNTDSVFSALVAGETVDYDQVAKDDAKCRAVTKALLHGRPVADTDGLFEASRNRQPRVVPIARLPSEYRHLEEIALPASFEDLQV